MSEVEKGGDNPVEVLSLQLMQQTQLNTELEHKLASNNRQLNETIQAKLALEKEFKEYKMQLIEKTNDQLQKSNEEVSSLREEIEQLSAALFTEANLQVETAKKSQWDVSKLNSRLNDTLKTKDNTIEMLQAEVVQFKQIIADLQSQLEGKSELELNNQDSPSLKRTTTSASILRSNTGSGLAVGSNTGIELPDGVLFDTPSLSKYNNVPISSCIFNQLRLDLSFANTFKDSLVTLSPDTWSIKSTKIFDYIVTEIESCVRLDKAPALRYKFNKRSILLSLLEYKACIEPLSAATESWKRGQLEQNLNGGDSLPNNDEPNPIKVPQPLAIHDPCSLCGEKNDTMNKARLYKMTIFKKEKDKENEIYNLCINCASKWRIVIPLMSFLSKIDPITDFKHKELINSKEFYIPSLDTLWDQYFQLISYLVSLTYLRLGIWEDNDVSGIVYGWKNKWIGKHIIESSPNATNDSTESFVSANEEASVPLATEKVTNTSDGGTGFESTSELSRTGSTNSSTELSNSKRSSKGVDLRVVSGRGHNSKRMSVNLNLLVGTTSPKKSDSALGSDDNELENELKETDTNENSKSKTEESDTPSID